MILFILLWCYFIFHILCTFNFFYYLCQLSLSDNICHTYLPCVVYNLPFLIFTMWNSKFTTHPLTFSLRHLLIHSSLSFLRNRVLSFEFYGFCCFERTFCDNSQSTYCTSQARTTCKSNWLFIFLYIFCDDSLWLLPNFLMLIFCSNYFDNFFFWFFRLLRDLPFCLKIGWIFQVKKITKPTLLWKIYKTRIKTRRKL